MASQPHRTPAAPIRQSDLSPEALTQQKKYETWLLSVRGISMETIANRMGYFRRINSEIGLAPTHEQVQEHIAELRRSGVSYAHTYNATIAIEDYMAFIGNPIRLGRQRKPRSLNKDGLSESEISLILHHARDLREKTILATLSYSGIRNKEFCELRIKDIDLAAYLISVRFGKGEQHYKAAITGDCAKMLGSYIQERLKSGATEDDRVFITKRHGYPMEQQDLRKMIRVSVKRAGINKPVSPHLFRHSLAMNMLNRGASLMTIQKQLGHGWIQSTMEYLRGEYTRGKHEYPLMAPNYL